MSDSCMYELEDIVWEEFGDNDDHIVPHTGGQKNGYGIESDSSKRPRCELTSTENNADSKSASNNVIQRKEESRFCAVKEEKEIMLEKSPRPHSSGAAVSASLGDSNRKTSNSTSDEAMTTECMARTNIDSTASELYGDDPIRGDQTVSVDNNLHRYQPNNASHTENDLGFFDQESSDLLFCGWPEIENFEDVDKMFRSCDSLFDLDVDNDDELGWFSSSQAIEGSDDVSKSSFNIYGSDPGGINNVTELKEDYGSNNAGLVVDEIDKKLTPVDWKRGSQKLTSDGSSIVMNTSCSNESGAVPNIEGDPQVCSHVSQCKNQKPSEGKRKEYSLSNGNSFLHFGDLKQEGELDQSLECSFWEETQQKQNLAPHACLQTSLPLMNSNTGHPSNQVLARPRSLIIKSKHSGFPSLSPREASSTSNQMQATESSHDVSLQHPSGYKKKARVNQRILYGHTKKSNLNVQRTDSDPVSGQKQVPNFENEVEDQGEVNGSDTGIPGELDSSTIRGSSCVRSVLDEVSIEESSLRQLQHVLEQLDIRTKLCIRDSLYRLARSAEQRHKCINSTSMSRDDKNPSRGYISDELNKSAGFIDVETDTNPIDRSIAHLLFHRPSDASATATLDVGPKKSHSMVQAPKSGPVTAEKFVGRGETTSGNIKLSKDESENCEN